MILKQDGAAVARQIHNLKVASSNLAPATNQKEAANPQTAIEIWPYSKVFNFPVR